MYLLCPSVPKLQNQATITAGQDCGLAEWIIDDSSLVFHLLSVHFVMKLTLYIYYHLDKYFMSNLTNHNIALTKGRMDDMVFQPSNPNDSNRTLIRIDRSQQFQAGLPDGTN